MQVGELVNAKMSPEEYLLMKLFTENKIMAIDIKSAEKEVELELDELQQVMLSLYRKKQIVFIPSDVPPLVLDNAFVEN